MSKSPSFKLNRAIEKLQFAIYDKEVRKQHAPYYEVKHKGTMVEFTDKREEAYDAWRGEPKVSTCTKIDMVGGRAIRTAIHFDQYKYGKK